MLILAIIALETVAMLWLIYIIVKKNLVIKIKDKVIERQKELIEIIQKRSGLQEESIRFLRDRNKWLLQRDLDRNCWPEVIE